MYKKIIIPIIVSVFIIGVTGFRILRNFNQGIIKVKTAVVVRGDIKDFMSTTGVIKSKNINEYYGLQNRIKKVHVKLGDTVRVGDTIVTYDMSDFGIDVKVAKLQYDNALLSYKELLSQRDKIDKRISELENKIYAIETMGEEGGRDKLTGLINERGALNPVSEEKIKQAKNIVGLAKVSLEEAEKKYTAKKHIVAADNSGVVTSVNAVEGNFPSALEPLVTIQDINNVKAVISIGKHDSERIKVGKTAVVEDDNRKFNGVVASIEPAAKKVVSMTGENALLTVEVDIFDKKPELKIGFDYDVDILLQEVKDVIKVPIESVKTDKFGNSIVYIIQNNRACERRVELGLESDNEVQINEGLKEGEKVVLNPGNHVKQGKRITEVVK